MKRQTKVIQRLKKRKFHKKSKKKSSRGYAINRPLLPSDEIIQLLSELGRLNLASKPEKETRELIDKLGRTGIVVFTLHPGKMVVRASRNDNPNESFSTKGRLTYKPAKYNTSFQRASTPNQTMFYGAVVPETIDKNTIDDAGLTTFLEVSRLHRDKVFEGKERLTFSRWVVTKDIPLIAIIHHRDYSKRTAHVREIYKAYSRFIKRYPKEKSNSMAITGYLAKEFGKKVDSGNENEYMISAIYSEMVVKRGLGGIYYPSTRADGQGFNVAISPDYVDNCMELVNVSECTAYKKDTYTVIDYDKMCILKPKQKEFELEPITDPRYHVGETEMLKKVEIELANQRRIKMYSA